MNQDPRGYYARLGVQPSAPAAVIRAAYRALAQEYHPDRNKAANATLKFQELQQAYDVLSDPAKRAEYDTSGAPRAEAPTRGGQSEAASTPAPPAYEPIRCARCNAVSATPRYRVFYSVIGYLVGATRTPTQGAYCTRCEATLGLRCTGTTLLFGWWSVHGFFWSLDAIAKNVFWARGYLEQTARLLAHQTGYFLATGNQRLAYSVALQALDASLRVRRGRSSEAKRRERLGYGEDDPISENIGHLTSFIQRAKEEGFTAPPLKDSFGVHSPAFRLQGSLVALMAAVLIGWAWVSNEQAVAAEQDRLRAAGLATAQAEAIARQQQEELARHLVPLPPNGFAQGWQTDNQPPLKVWAPSDTNAYVKVTLPSSQQAVATLFVRAGQAAETTIPPGTYSVKIAYGHQWYGEEIRFGPNTVYSMVPDLVEFTIRGHQLLGHELNLNRVRNGNLHTQGIGAAQF
jgi:hypothetical protein